MKKIIEVGSDEDGEVFFVVGDTTRLGALRAILKFIKDNCGIDDDWYPKLEDLEESNFWYTESGEYEGWYWWGNPPRGSKSVGLGWIYKVF